MGLKKRILNIVLSFLSIFLCFFPKKKNRVTFVSLTADELQGNFKLIADELKSHENIEIYTILTKYEKTLLGNFLYFVNCIKQLFIINTSKVVILNDNNFVVSNYKKSNPIVIQIWHACGAIKKFGNDIHREYEIKGYDYVISTSDIWKPIYANSFHVQEAQVIALGVPCTDELLDKRIMDRKKHNLFKKYPAFVDKYVVLYAPTFRGNIIKGMKHIELNLDNIIEHLPDNFIILYKLHPLLENIKLGIHDRVVNVKEEDLYSLLAASDCLVSDYSSILFDYLLLEKKQIYYIPDFQEYNRGIGTNIEFKHMPGEICDNEEGLIKSLLRKDHVCLSEIKKCKEHYFKYTDGKSTLRVVDFIIQEIENS